MNVLGQRNQLKIIKRYDFLLLWTNFRLRDSEQQDTTHFIHNYRRWFIIDNTLP